MDNQSVSPTVNPDDFGTTNKEIRALAHATLKRNKNFWKLFGLMMVIVIIELVISATTNWLSDNTSPIVGILSSAVGLVMLVVNIGVSWAMVDLLRGQKFNLNHALTNALPSWLKIIASSAILSVFAVLIAIVLILVATMAGSVSLFPSSQTIGYSPLSLGWSTILTSFAIISVPSIILLLAVSQTFYLIKDHPNDFGMIGYIRESMRRIKGKKIALVRLLTPAILIGLAIFLLLTFLAMIRLASFFVSLAENFLTSASSLSSVQTEISADLGQSLLLMAGLGLVFLFLITAFQVYTQILMAAFYVKQIAEPEPILAPLPAKTTPGGQIYPDAVVPEAQAEQIIAESEGSTASIYPDAVDPMGAIAPTKQPDDSQESQ